MATYRLRRFSCPETLKSIKPAHLIALLTPFEQFLQRRGVKLPNSNDDGKLNYGRIAAVFMAPGPDTPKDLVDALYFIDEMSSPDDMDLLLAEVNKPPSIAIEVGDDQSPADVAVQVWLADRNVLERKHAERHLLKSRSFESFQSKNGQRPKLTPPSPRVQRALENDLDEWFERHNRGRDTRVFMFDRNDGTWFLVRHGEPYKREGSIEKGKSSSVHFRPEKYDVVVFHPGSGELRINAKSRGESQLYRSQFGLHLFGSEEFFPGINKYTLEPLREYGPASLNCIDIDGIDWIKLTEVQILYAGTPWELVSRRADDLFAVLESRSREFPDAGRIVRASFRVKFSDCKTPRSVVIKPSNVAQFTRDDDSVFVEEWLNARGFIVDTTTVQKRSTRRVARR